MMPIRSLLLALIFGLLTNPVYSAEILIAVAANFTTTAQEIVTAFEKDTGNKVNLSSGSTGKLYTQIFHGAPYDIFLAADIEHPALAEQRGLAVRGSSFTYARGKLVLFSHNSKLDLAEGKILKHPETFNRLATANTLTSPYGVASEQVIRHFGTFQALEEKSVKGDNVAQVYQFVITLNADLGFVALSQVKDQPPARKWIVPEPLYKPIRQHAVLLKKAENNQAALAFMRFLRSSQARQIIASHGYALE
jgi:molybdate transport system substrate-binding protein